MFANLSSNFVHIDDFQVALQRATEAEKFIKTLATKSEGQFSSSILSDIHSFNANLTTKLNNLPKQFTRSSGRFNKHERTQNR